MSSSRGTPMGTPNGPRVPLSRPRWRQHCEQPAPASGPARDGPHLIPGLVRQLPYPRHRTPPEESPAPRPEPQRRPPEALARPSATYRIALTRIYAGRHPGRGPAQVSGAAGRERRGRRRRKWGARRARLPCRSGGTGHRHGVCLVPPRTPPFAVQIIRTSFGAEGMTVTGCPLCRDGYGHRS
jgi:hypothetical protein